MLRTWLAIATFLAAPSAATAECTMALVSKLPITVQDSSPMVTATLNGRPAQLIFDTGAYTSVLTLTAANRLDLRHLTSEEFDSVRGSVAGIGGDRSTIAMVAKTVEHGGLHAHNYNFIAADMLRPPIDGLLSADLVSQFDIDLDFPEHQVQLFKPLGDCSAPAAFLSGPLYQAPLLPVGEDRRPRIAVTIGGQSVVALIDTGASHTVLFRGAAERLGLVSAAPGASRQATYSGIGPKLVSGTTRKLDSIAIGDLEIGNLSVAVLQAPGDDEVEMILGADFQRQVHLWISYSSHTLIMQYPPVPTKHVSAG